LAGTEARLPEIVDGLPCARIASLRTVPIGGSLAETPSVIFSERLTHRVTAPLAFLLALAAHSLTGPFTPKFFPAF
jgi:hypothetical protein